MPPILSELALALQGGLAALQEQFWNGWSVIQLAFVLAAWGVSLLAGKRLEPVVEARARRIKRNPDLLRLAIAVVRRLHWAVFVSILFVLRLGLVAAGVPNRLVGMVLLLAAAWLAIAVLTRIIRNRTLARSVAVVGWIYVALSVLGLDQAVASALDLMAIRIGEFRLSALMVVNTVLLATAVIWLAMFLSHLIENQINKSEDITPSFKVLFGKLIRIGLVLIAGLVALTSTGIDLTALTVLSGAVGVGIGFGLQKVVSNFISGIIILLDRSIKPKDTIALGDTFGSVHELRARFVSVITRDGRKYLIPNEDFITQQVINWSYSDQFVRLDVDFAVAYNSDPHQVTAVAIEAARRIERVSEHRAPVCWLTEFGENGLCFKLRFWISDPHNGLTNVRGQVLLALWDSFKAHNIKVPFPQREVTLKGGIPPIAVQEAPLDATHPPLIGD